MLSSIVPIAVAALAVAPSALGRITNITFPSSGSAGETISASVTNENYISNEQDFGIIFGLARTQYYCGTCVGTQISYFNNYNETSKGSIIPLYRGSPYEVNITLPTNLETGDYKIVAAVPHLVGASGGTSIAYFNQTFSYTNNDSSS